MGLEAVELVVSWEQAFSISIPNDLASTLETPEKAAAAIQRLLEIEGRNVPRSEIEEIIRKSTLELSGMDESDYKRDGRFVEDFGLD